MISQSHTECTYDPYVPWLGTLVRVFSVVVPLGLEKDHVKDVTDIKFMVLIIPLSCFYWGDLQKGTKHQAEAMSQMHPVRVDASMPWPLFPL